ncbi:glycoside hydrolase family 25 protein [Pseudomonas fluorescens group sp. PF-1]
MPSTLPGTIDVIVDLNHDNEIDFKKIKRAGIVGVIHKASEGATFRDEKYLPRRKLALEAGLLWGAYHFSSSRNVDDQVNNFLQAIDWEHLKDKSTLLCLDFEPSTSGPDMTIEQAQEFVSLVNDKTGRWPMIYGGSLLRESISHHAPDDILKNCPLWYARYRDKPIGIPVDTWPDFTLWQYSDGNHGPKPHEVSGMGRADRNCFNGTLEDLKAGWPFASYHLGAPYN